MRTRRVLVGLGLGALGLQLVQPGPPRAVLPGDGSMRDHLDVPDSIARLMRRACDDCHSAQTRWPWYARVSPVSWLIFDDVQHGRSNLDFTSWSTDPEREPTPDQRLRWMCREARDGTMPPRLYRLVHPASRLSGEEKEALCAWSEEARQSLGPSARPAPDGEGPPPIFESPAHGAGARIVSPAAKPSGRGGLPSGRPPSSARPTSRQ